MFPIIAINQLSLLIGIFILLVAVFVVVFLHFLFQHLRYTKHIVPRARNSVFLEIQIPKEDSGENQTGKTETSEERNSIIAFAEQVFTNLSAENFEDKSIGGRYDSYISFEIVALRKKISFYINCPRTLRDLLEKQIQAQYSNAQIDEVSAYNPFVLNAKQAASELVLQK